MYLTFKHGLLLIALFIIINLLVSLLFMAILPITNLTTSWMGLVNYVITFIATLFVARYLFQSFNFDQQHTKATLYLVLLPGIIGVSILTEGLVSLIPMPQIVADYFAKLIHLDLAGYLAVGIAAPILEELIFRGIILKAYLTHYSPTKAIVFSALIFGIAHLNPWQFAAAFTIGLIIGWVYYYTRSIWPGIFIHFINNSLSFGIAYYFQDLNIPFYQLVSGWIKYFAILLGSLLTCYLVYMQLNKMFKKILINT